MFDPYHKWLGIPKDQRPPTYYQLLGIAPTEADAEVIDEAAVRQTTHVRAYQIGDRAAECTKLLNEIAQAKLTLLNPGKRKAYDEQLAKAKASAITAKPTAPVGVAAAPAPAAFHFDRPVEPPIAKVSRRDLNIAKSQGAMTLWVILGVGGGVLALAILVVAVAFAWRSAPAPLPKQPPVLVAKKDEVKPIPKPPDEPNKIDDPPPFEDKWPKKKKKVQPPDEPPAELGVAGARRFQSTEKHIEWLSLSPDGSKVAAGFLNPSVYDVATGQKLAMFAPRVRKGGILRTPVAFFPDNRRVLFAHGIDSAAAAGDSANGQTLFHLEQDGVQFATCLAVDKDGKRALVAYNYRLVYWNLETQQEIKTWKTKGIVDEVIFTPDGHGAVTGEKSGVVVTWDLDQLTTLQQYKTPPKLHALAITPDGSTVACGATGVITLIDLKTRQMHLVNNAEFSGAVAFCSGGKHFLAGNIDGKVRFFDGPPVKQLGVLKGHNAQVTRIAVDAKEQIAVSADKNGAVIVWPLGAALLAKMPPEAAPPAANAANAPPGMRQIIQKQAQGVYRAEMLPDGASFVSGGLRVQHWDMDGTLRKQFVQRKSTGDLFGLALTPDGKRVLWGEGLDSPQLLDIATGQVLGAIGRPTRLTSLAISPDGKHALAAFGQEAPIVWDVAGQKVVRELPMEGYVATVAFCPLGKYVLRAQLTGLSKWLDRNTWEEVTSFNVGPVFRSPAFTSDGKLAALPTSNQGIALIETGAKLAKAFVPVQPALQVAFCARDTLLLARPLNNKNIQVWDVATQALVATWELPHQVSAFAVNRDASSMVSITMAGNAYTWPLPKTRADLK